MSEIQRARQLAQEGVTAGRAGNHDEARQKLGEATRLDPNNPDAWYWLGLFLEDRQQQIQCLQRVLFLQPNHPQAREALASMQATGPQPPPQQQGYQGQQPYQSPPQQPGQMQQAFSQAGEALGGAARQAGQQVWGELSGEQGRNLFKAWGAALRFDSDNSYELYRGQPRPWFTAIMIFFVTAAALTGNALLNQLNNPYGFDAGGLIGGIVRGLLLAAQLIIALYVASWVASYIGRIRFKSNVGTAAHFGLSGLYYVPILLVAILFSIFQRLITSIFIEPAFTASSDALQNALSYTVLVIGIYVIGQFVYSNASIHRVSAFPAVIISVVALLVAFLAFLWLLPLTSLVSF